MSESKPRYRMNEHGHPMPVIDWRVVQAMEVDTQVAYFKAVLKVHGPFILNDPKFMAWTTANHEAIISWHMAQKEYKK